mmetsp:Transcript_11608/g.48299  ORF Transcript_11608/g.48299 Transcript_11608/m.48299 type:complete len:107 (+) Transcript_11608:1045-1365(+)
MYRIHLQIAFVEHSPSSAKLRGPLKTIRSLAKKAALPRSIERTLKIPFGTKRISRWWKCLWPCCQKAQQESGEGEAAGLIRLGLAFQLPLLAGSCERGEGGCVDGC